MSSFLEQLADLVKIRSITGEEQQIIKIAASFCKGLGLPVEESKDGIIISIGKGGSPSLVMCSHLDTVVAGNNWTAAPFEGKIFNNTLIGRGAVDAKASCLSMIHTALALKDANFDGSLHVLLSIGEEGNSPSLPYLLDNIEQIDAGIVGEPTMMNIATSQRGLLVAELSVAGKQEHAARSNPPNSIEILCEDILKISKIEWPRHEKLGNIKITPTRLNAGVADNVTPPEAHALLDIRTTPVHSHKKIIEILDNSLTSGVNNVADVWIPCETPENSSILVSAKNVLKNSSVFSSEATSDWVFLQKKGIPSIKTGPGNPVYSHQADEQITSAELELGIKGYINIAKEFLKIQQP